MNRIRQLLDTRKILTTLVICSPAIYCAATRTYSVTTVKGSSMAPAINEVPGTTCRLLINKYANFKYDTSLLKVNDIVYIRSPWDPSRLLVKRIKAVQGDTVRPREQSRYPKKLVRVPQNHVWVEGDNSFHSIDSNNFGPISIGLIEARVVGKLDFGSFPILQKLKDNGGREARLLVSIK